jgi:predicted transcriptional regulator
MKRTTCEYIMWRVLPAIRKGFAESMINDFGLNQKETAEKLGLTPPAVCNYVLRKRGKVDISEEFVLKEIKVSAGNIIENGSGSVLSETCRICKLLRSRPEISLFCPSCDE